MSEPTGLIRVGYARGVTIDMDCRRDDLLEELTYAYTVVDGHITTLVGRYR